MHYAPIPGLTPHLDYDQAVKHKTPKSPTSPWVMPGRYTVRLTVDGHSYTQPLQVRMDPRVKTSDADLKRQFELAKQAYDQAIAGLKALGQIRDLQRQLKTRQQRSGGSARAIAAYAKKLKAIAGPKPTSPYFFYIYQGPPVLASVAFSLRRSMGAVENADRAPTEAQSAAIGKAAHAMQTLLARWKTLKRKPLADLNAQLRHANLQPLAAVAGAPILRRWDRMWIKYYRADR
jgi:hypothetical protein